MTLDDANPHYGMTSAERGRIRRLRTGSKRFEKERNLLKRATAFFGEEPTVGEHRDIASAKLSRVVADGD